MKIRFAISAHELLDENAPGSFAHARQLRQVSNVDFLLFQVGNAFHQVAKRHTSPVLGCCLKNPGHMHVCIGEIGILLLKQTNVYMKRHWRNLAHRVSN
jgi:hypothetical protein